MLKLFLDRHVTVLANELNGVRYFVNQVPGHHVFGKIDRTAIPIQPFDISTRMGQVWWRRYHSTKVHHVRDVRERDFGLKNSETTAAL